MKLFAITVAVMLTAGMSTAPTALALEPPRVDRQSVPADGMPYPEQPMRQSTQCATAIAPDDPKRPSAGFTVLNVDEAWKYSTGQGVSVAVIDTGVTPNPRLDVRAGGDYITGGDGLSDCDAHGTIVASVIAAKPSATDGVAGVAPDASVISIRQSSRAFQGMRERAGTVATLAKAIVHAANLGAQVINISVTACMPAAEPLDQRTIGAAVWYAATVKDAVVVAAAGNEGEEGCVQNPIGDPVNPSDPRDWSHVRTISSPSWFSDYVLSVGAVTTTGEPIDKSLAGPWLGVAAPGIGVMGLSPKDGTPVNAHPPTRPGDRPVPFWGTSFAAAFVSGVAALVRSKFPTLSAQEVMHRIVATAHNPARGVDNRIGYGVLDPVAALTFAGRSGDVAEPGAQSRLIIPPAAPPPPDHRARDAAVVVAGVFGIGVLLTPLLMLARRAR